jgi:hypothetical protein
MTTSDFYTNGKPFEEEALATLLFERKRELVVQLEQIDKQIGDLKYKRYCGRPMCEPGDCEHVSK